MRIFLDANIMFSAAATDGAVRRLIKDLLKEEHELVMDGYVWEEARRNLATRYPEAIQELHELSAQIELHSTFAGVGVDLPDSGLPEDDLPVLASALALKCGCLVTGDKTHFGSLFQTTIDGVTIHSPRSLAEEIWGKG